MTAVLDRRVLDLLLNRCVDEDWNEADEAVLASLLERHPEARRRYLEFIQLHAALHWNHGALASLLVVPEEHLGDIGLPPDRSMRRLRFRTAWLSVAVMATLALVAWSTSWFWTDTNASRDAKVVARIEMIQGTVLFRPVGQESLSPLHKKQDGLGAGTLLIEGESSAIQWRFDDGTLITLSGDSEVTLSDGVQKRLRLREGLLTAEVEPQPSHAPMIVETSTAQVEVVGTIFTLTAEAERTRLRVDEGVVRLRRLVDGQTIEVRQKQSCTSSLDAGERLEALEPSELSRDGQHRFAQPPPRSWLGEWLPPEPDLVGRLRAVPIRAGRVQHQDQVPLVHYGIRARKGDGVHLGVISREGRLRVIYRTAESARIQIVLGLHLPGGGFGGNFELKPPVDASIVHQDDWQELDVPLSLFQPLGPRHRSMTEDSQPFFLLITTFEKDAGLEVSDFAILQADTVNR